MQLEQSLTAHQDKVVNKIAHSTKIHFLQQQIYHLGQLKETLQIIQRLVKPSSKSNDHVAKLQKKISQQQQVLKEQTLFVRREISMLETKDYFQTKIAESYQQTIEICGNKLEKMEETVQMAQQQKKAQQELESVINVHLKVQQNQRCIQKYLISKQMIKQHLKDRLILIGLITQKKKKLSHCIVSSKMYNYSFRKYHYLYRMQQHYPSKSSDKLNEHHNKIVFKQANMKTKKLVRDHNTKLSNQLLASFQKDIYTDSLNQIKKANGKLQVKIQCFQRAIQEAENEKIYSMLESSKDLDMQKTVGRQLLAHYKMGKNFSERLSKYSFKWTFEASFHQKTNKSQQWDWEKEKVKQDQKEIFLKRRSQSVEKSERPIERPFLKMVQPNKSIPKTNCSLECTKFII